MATRPDGGAGWGWLFAFLALAGLSGPAAAQVDGLAGALPTAPSADPEIDASLSGGPKRAWHVVPRVTLGTTYTDNALLANANPRTDTSTDIAPGIRIESATARLKAHLDYQFKHIHYARDTAADQRQNDLNAFGRLEAIDDRAFVDFTGNISQRATSAFGPQGPGAAPVSGNHTEVRTYSLSPWLTGRLGGLARYDLRFAARATDSGQTGGAGDSTSQEWSAALGGDTRFARWSWGLSATRQDVDYDGRRTASIDALSGRLTYALDAQYRVWASGGRESNNYTTAEKTASTTRGLGLEWEPGPRTRVSASRESRFFGNSDQFEFQHRRARAAFTLSHRTSISELPQQLTRVSLGTNFDILSAQLASSIPDPIARANAVNALLASTGLSPNALVTSEFLASQVTLQRNTVMSLALQGVRNTVTFSAARGLTRSLLNATAGDDFDTFSRIEQTGYTAQWALRLSPKTALNALASRQDTRGSGTAAASTRLVTLQAGVQRTLGRNSTLSLSGRRSDFEGTSLNANYIENSATAALSHRFN